MSIDSCYEGAIAKLTSQGKIVDISKKLLSLNNNDDRVSYVYGILEGLHAFPDILNVPKCQNVSTHYRNHGNECFQKSDNYMAWQYYNLSLLHSQFETENYCLAISNRSAVLFALGKYQECLFDIETALSMSCPDKLKAKLLNRQKSCNEYILKGNNENEENPDIENILTMQAPKDLRYLCASSKLDVVCTEAMGRHVVAKEDINVGEVLVQEWPYLSVLLTSQILFHCSYCLSRSANLYPCNSCCFALYCSKQCSEKANKDYHRIECPLMASLVHMEFTKLELLALRTVIKARSEHKDWQSLFDTIEKADENAKGEFRGHIQVDDRWVYDSKYYESIHTLASNVERRSISDIFQKAVTAAVFLRLLIDGTDFLQSDNEEESLKIRKCVGGMLLLHVMTSPTNMHGVSANTQNSEGNYVDEFSIGSAPYAFHSLLNHSCAPNVLRSHKLGTGFMTLFALRPIKKGQQLFDNYGSHHALKPFMMRQKDIHSQYKFLCQCEACVENWPTYFSLPPAKNLPKAIRTRKEKLLNIDIIEKLQKGDKDTALKIFKQLCEMAETLEPYAPCKELADCQETLKQCVAIFEGVVPYGYSRLLEWTAIPPKV